MPKPAARAASPEIDILELKVTRLTMHIFGTRPLIFNQMSEKTRRTLLLPRGGRMNDSEKATNLKHDPLAEYRDSVYRARAPESETTLIFPGSAVKDAILTAALEMPGTRRSEVGRLIIVDNYSIPVWGVPQMFLTSVRQAGIARTPDIRTRAIVPRWAASFQITFVGARLTMKQISHLVATAGIICGIGDFRQGKGKGSFGTFDLVNAEDPAFAAVVRDGGRAAQDAALDSPGFFDADSEEIYGWYNAEIERRGRKQK